MTEQEIRSKVVETAKKYVGLKEKDAKHREILSGYNSHKPLARSYAVQLTDAWCATFVSFVAIKCGLTDIMPTECGCQKMIELYQKLGRWKEDESYVPATGDVIMYDWQDGGSGDNKGVADHVGIVVSVTNGTIKVIEGNISDSVGYRNISVNGKNIRGYCLPDYASKATKAAASSVEKPAKTETPVKTESPAATTATIDAACSFSKSVAGTYKVTATLLNVRSGAGTSKRILTTLMTGTKVQNYGYYTMHNGVKWLCIQFVQNGKTITGFVSSKYLKK